MGQGGLELGVGNTRFNHCHPISPVYVQDPLHAAEVNDYRPVLNAEATTALFERNPTATPNDIKLYSLDFATGDVQPFVNFASTRPDWCWNRSGGGLTSGPVAFSNDNPIFQ